MANLTMSPREALKLRLRHLGDSSVGMGVAELAHSALVHIEALEQERDNDRNRVAKEIPLLARQALKAVFGAFAYTPGYGPDWYELVRMALADPSNVARPQNGESNAPPVVGANGDKTHGRERRSPVEEGGGSERAASRDELRAGGAQRSARAAGDEAGRSEVNEAGRGNSAPVPRPEITEAFVFGMETALAASPPKMVCPVVTDEMVSRFLCWNLPQDFAPDCHISFKQPDPILNPNPSWPVGTNLLTADQTRAMLEHVLADSAPNKRLPRVTAVTTDNGLNPALVVAVDGLPGGVFKPVSKQGEAIWKMLDAAQRAGSTSNERDRCKHGQPIPLRCVKCEEEMDSATVVQQKAPRAWCGYCGGVIGGVPRKRMQNVTIFQACARHEGQAWPTLVPVWDAEIVKVCPVCQPPACGSKE